MNNKTIFSRASTISAALFVVGVLGWLGSWAFLDKPPWGIFVSLLVLGTGVTQGAFIIAIVLRAASADWGARLYRLTASAALAFLPLAAAMLFIILAARTSVIPWAGEADQNIWYNPLFFLGRNLLYFGLFYGLTYSMFRTSRLKGARGARIGNHRLTILGLLTTLTFVLGASFFSWDFGMTLYRHWGDSIYGTYYIMTSLFGGAALIILLITFLNWATGTDYFTPLHFRNLGALALGLTVVSFYGWWSQFFPIWYANLPVETSALYLRIFSQWSTTYGIMMILVTVVPFVALLFKRVRESVAGAASVAVVILVGLWVQQYLYTAAPLIKADRAADLSVLSLPNLALTAGVLGGFLFILFRILENYPEAYLAPQAEDTGGAETEADYLFTQPEGW